MEKCRLSNFAIVLPIFTVVLIRVTKCIKHDFYDFFSLFRIIPVYSW